MKRFTSYLLVFALILSMVPGALAAGETGEAAQALAQTDEGIIWSYLDDNTDPAGDPNSEGYDRTSWTAENFSAADNWKTAAGSFGSKRGTANYDPSTNRIANTILEGCDGANNYPTYYFRSTFNIPSLEGVTKLVGSLEYDDGVIVYVNGRRVAAGHDIACNPDSGASLGHGFTANNQYGGSNQGPDTLNFELLDISFLHEGANTIAVELHNGRKTSSDVWFHMTDLRLSNEAVVYQSNISLSMGSDESQMNFTWYSALKDAKLLVAENETMSDAQIIAATANTANDGQYSCKATVTGLRPNTTYYYQMENAGNKSGVYHFTTGGNSDFSFAFMGDPQIGAGNTVTDTQGWEKTLNLVKENPLFSDVSFLLSAGDQVNTNNNENQYDGYLDHDALTGLPAATVIGNHDSGSDAYSQHFNVANASASTGDSWFVYNKALFLVLNSNDMSTAEHKQFMVDAINATKDQDIQWKIVTFHHSVYSVANHAVESDILQRRNDLVPIFKELDIDAVLMGHDHVYVRSYMMDGLQPMTDASIYDDEQYSSITDPTGILYVTANSASGSKFYTIKNAKFDYAAVQNQERVPNVSKVSVGENRFTITTYRTSDMSVVDTFTINRTAAQETGYTVTFAADEHATIDTYYTKEDYTKPSETNVTSAVARSDTGEIDTSGDGQVNFKVNVAEGYAIDSVVAEPKENFKNLKDSTDTKVEGMYRLTKVTGPVTVTVTTRKADPAGPEEPTYTPVVTGDTRVQGFYNADAALKIELAGRYNSNAMSEDGGSLEIVQYNAANGFAYAVSGVKGKLIAVDLNGSMDGDKAASLAGTEYDVKSMVNAGDFTYGDMTSVAISPDGSKLAAAIQAKSYEEKGMVALFSCKADGTLDLIGTTKVGVQPDMVTFADNNTILTADEGEPRQGTAGADPKGSVTIVTLDESAALTANTVTFDRFDSQREALTGSGVLVQKDMYPSTDFEPEYIAVSDGKAYVSLQENNAVAVLDIAAGTFTGVYPLGFQNFGETKVDLQKNNKIELKNYENVYGIRMPDGIAVAAIGGKTYLLTANEGDSRADWPGMDNEAEGKTSPTGNVELDNKVVWFDAAKWDGLDADKAYVFGGRSFSIYEMGSSGLTLVYDSGSGFEEITAETLKDYFNCSNDKISMDNRSGKKGPEPEAVVTGTVGGKLYAFIALERISGVMVYDITDPGNAKFVNYINSREFDTAIQGDVSPEGMCFIPAANGRKAMLLAACEVSGTLAAYDLTPAAAQGGSSGGGSSSGSSTGGKPSTVTPGQDENTDIFRDVQKDAYYYDAVAWAVKNQVTSGTSATAFSPDAACTRAQIVTFL